MRSVIIKSATVILTGIFVCVHRPYTIPVTVLLSRCCMHNCHQRTPSEFMSAPINDFYRLIRFEQAKWCCVFAMVRASHNATIQFSGTNGVSANKQNFTARWTVMRSLRKEKFFSLGQSQQQTAFSQLTQPQQRSLNKRLNCLFRASSLSSQIRIVHTKKKKTTPPSIFLRTNFLHVCGWKRDRINSVWSAWMGVCVCVRDVQCSPAILLKQRKFTHVCTVNANDADAKMYATRDEHKPSYLQWKAI